MHLEERREAALEGFLGDHDVVMMDRSEIPDHLLGRMTKTIDDVVKVYVPQSSSQNPKTPCSS